MIVKDNATSAAPRPHKPMGWALIIDDHPLFCDALKITLKSLVTFHEMKTANSMEAGLAAVESASPPSLVLLDLNLPDATGLDGLIHLKRRIGKTPIIIVSSMSDNSIISAAIVAGASGFVPKHSPRAVFKDALDQIERGEVYKPAGYVESNGTSERDEMVTRLSSLTNQQARILDLICEGKLNKQIAFDLSIAETTVKAHVTAIMRKLGVQSRTQAVLVAQGAQFSYVLPSHE
ncbi:MAG: LuxR C-terminal-related transcriptional regulator [Primorskyibacter sp.]